MQIKQIFPGILAAKFLFRNKQNKKAQVFFGNKKEVT